MFFKRNVYMCHGSTNFRLRPMRSHPMDGISSGVMANLSGTMMNCWLLPYPFRKRGNTVDYESNSVSRQNLQIAARGQYRLHHMPPMCDLPPFLGYKNPCLMACRQSLG